MKVDKEKMNKIEINQKYVIVPFDISKIDNSDVMIKTRGGYDVKILHKDLRTLNGVVSITPIVALLTFDDGSEQCKNYRVDGFCSSDGKKSDFDLVMMVPAIDFSSKWRLIPENKLKKYLGEWRAGCYCSKCGNYNGGVVSIPYAEDVDDGDIIFAYKCESCGEICYYKN